LEVVKGADYWLDAHTSDQHAVRLTAPESTIKELFFARWFGMNTRKRLQRCRLADFFGADFSVAERAK
jgi:hypothetical protein